jgi:hypothetical protein
MLGLLSGARSLRRPSLVHAVLSLEVGDDFLSCRRAEVPDSPRPVKSGAPSPAEFGNIFRQELDFAVVVR